MSNPKIERPQLLQQLAKQLTYYFSKQNLAKDVYLKTIMDLNSGFAPITILAGFSNVNKIISRSGILYEQDASDGDNVEDEHDDSDTQTEKGTSSDTNENKDPIVQGESGENRWNEARLSKIQNLLEEAAIESTLLSVVKLNQDGEIVQQELTDPDVRTFDAIGPSLDFNGAVPDVSEVSSKVLTGGEYHETSNSASEASVKNSDSNAHKPTIFILRDVHMDATEGDIHKVFEQNHVISVQKEIGNCWFVTLDMKNSPDLVSIMLDLRSKTICDEPIKARVKTQTTRSSGSSPPLSSSGKYHQQQYSNRHSYSRNNERKTEKSGESSSVSSRGYVNNVYAGDRVIFPSKKFAKGSYGNNGATMNSSRRYKQYQPRDGKRFSDTDSVDNKSKKFVPPPPVVEEHYPSLGLGDSSPTSVANPDMGGDETKKTNGLGKIMGGAYAAALLKEGPKIPSTNTPKSRTKVVAPLSVKTHAKKDENNRIFSQVKNTSMMTSSTDDSSSDDKSSLSSRPESESFAIGVAATSAISTSSNVTWGGGRSFADILKK